MLTRPQRTKTHIIEIEEIKYCKFSNKGTFGFVGEGTLPAFTRKFRVFDFLREIIWEATWLSDTAILQHMKQNMATFPTLSGSSRIVLFLSVPWDGSYVASGPPVNSSGVLSMATLRPLNAVVCRLGRSVLWKVSLKIKTMGWFLSCQLFLMWIYSQKCLCILSKMWVKWAKKGPKSICERRGSKGLNY